MCCSKIINFWQACCFFGVRLFRLNCYCVSKHYAERECWVWTQICGCMSASIGIMQRIHNVCVCVSCRRLWVCVCAMCIMLCVYILAKQICHAIFIPTNGFSFQQPFCALLVFVLFTVSMLLYAHCLCWRSLLYFIVCMVFFLLFSSLQ